jgi:hypothetical protein
LKARIFSPFYNYEGKRTDDPNEIELIRRHSDYPMEFHLYDEINNYFKDIRLLQDFLKECEYISDEKHFNKKDFWMLAKNFENEKKGDCEDFSLYTWRQLLKMGYKARLVIGFVSKKMNGHAWITAIKDNKAYIVDPTLAKIPLLTPGLVSRYVPIYSIGIEEDKLVFFRHKINKSRILLIKVFSHLLTIIELMLFILIIPILIIPANIRKRIRLYKKLMSFKYL